MQLRSDGRVGTGCLGHLQRHSGFDVWLHPGDVALFCPSRQHRKQLDPNNLSQQYMLGFAISIVAMIRGYKVRGRALCITNLPPNLKSKEESSL